MSCPQCTQGYVLPGEPAGSMVDGVYFSPAPEGVSATKAVVLLTDIFGLALKNNKILADELAKRVGCDVWVPDLFAGPSRPCAMCLRRLSTHSICSQASHRLRWMSLSLSSPTALARK